MYKGKVSANLASLYAYLRDPVSRTEHDRFHNLIVDAAVYGDRPELCTFKVNRCSLTLDTTEGLIETWIEACQSFYPDAAITQGDTHGVQIKGPYYANMGGSPCQQKLGTISITLYSSTSRIHVQGSSYILWLEEHYPRLRGQVEATTSKRGLALKDRRSSNRPRKISTLASGQKCATCDKCISDATKTEAWCCQLCASNYHHRCTTPSAEDDTVCPTCLSQTSESTRTDTEAGLNTADAK